MYPTAKEIAQRHHRNKEPEPMRDLTFSPTEQALLAVMEYLMSQQHTLRATIDRMDTGRHGE